MKQFGMCSWTIVWAVFFKMSEEGETFEKLWSCRWIEWKFILAKLGSRILKRRSLSESPKGRLLRTDVHIVFSDSALCVGNNNVMHSWYVLWRIMCASVQSWIQGQRIWQDYILWYHRHRMYQTKSGCSPEEVNFHTPLRYSIDLEQFVAEEVGRISHCEEARQKAQPPTDQSKKAIIDKATIRMKAAPPPVEERLWQLFRLHWNTTTLSSWFRRKHRQVLQHVGESCEYPQQEPGTGRQTFSPIQEQCESQTSHARTVLLEQKKTQCSHVRNQLRETRCDHSFMETALQWQSTKLLHGSPSARRITSVDRRRRTAKNVH